jgi:hypothetical protein
MCTGKLRSGKSVLLVNIINDLNLNVDTTPVTYFFCQHDGTSSAWPACPPGTEEGIASVWIWSRMHLPMKVTFSIVASLAVRVRRCEARVRGGARRALGCRASGIMLF